MPRADGGSGTRVSCGRAGQGADAGADRAAADRACVGVIHRTATAQTREEQSAK